MGCGHVEKQSAPVRALVAAWRSMACVSLSRPRNGATFSYASRGALTISSAAALAASSVSACAITRGGQTAETMEAKTILNSLASDFVLPPGCRLFLCGRGLPPNNLGPRIFD
jgi:hypothetical protein